MSRNFQQAGSLFHVVKHCRRQDCSNLFRYLDDRGTEIFCELLHFIIRGDLELYPASHTRIKKKIKKYVKEIKRLITPPRHSKDIATKRRILQKKGIVRILSSIAAAATPIIKQLLAEVTLVPPVEN